MRIADWPFALKMGAGPALAVFGMIGLAALGYRETSYQNRLVQQVAERETNAIALLTKIAMDMRRVNADLYRLLALQAANAQPDTKEGLHFLDIATQAAMIELQDYARLYAYPDTQTDVADLIKLIATYREALSVVGSMLELSFASAVELILPLDSYDQRIQGELLLLVDRTVIQASQQATRATRSARKAELTYTVAAVTVPLLVAALAFVLTRATVRSVRHIADATLRVARGDQVLDISALGREDELGAIVESLHSFQTNVAQIAFLARHDALTRLPNRVMFHDRIEAALAQLGRGCTFATLCIDLDRFKIVNDTLGHPVGDELLIQVANRLLGCVREGDTVARLGGDEFAIVLVGAELPAEADRVARRIIHAVSEPFQIQGQTINIGASVGIALAPADGQHVDKLMRNADTALYRAKTLGRGTHCFFKPEMDAELQVQRAMELDLRSALEAEEFELHYQPLISVQTREINAFEALIRWHHPRHGLVPPADFIPIAEQTGLIVAIGQWVLRRACLDAAAWPAHIRVAVNLSSVQFRSTNLEATVVAALEEGGLAPGRLELEITESVLLENSEPVLTMLHRLRARGIHMAMDDFGTGYSSLSYLRKFPFDKIKIDRSFVNELPLGCEASAIIRAVINLGRSLGMSVVAEGVETEAQARQLAVELCTELQGYLFSKPRPAAEVPALLAAFAQTSGTAAEA